VSTLSFIVYFQTPSAKCDLEMSAINNKVPAVRQFYANNRLVCMVGLENTRLMRAGSMALAQLHASTSLLQTDGTNTVVAAHVDGLHDFEAYSPYGFSPVQKILAIIGFVGEWRDTQTECYPLGNGRRLFSPSLRRLTGPDVLSPFGRGGLNAYTYCAGDPINYSDPSGQWRVSVSGIVKNFFPEKKTGATALLQEKRAPMTLKPFIRHLAQGQGDVNALLIVPNGSGHAAAKLYKAEGEVRFEPAGRDFLLSFVPTASAQRDGHVFAVDRGALPMGVKGYEYFSYSTPLFSSRPSTQFSRSAPPPTYDDATLPSYGDVPPSYEYVTRLMPAIRKTSG
jgi:RHS repeat-associated protein